MQHRTPRGLNASDYMKIGFEKTRTVHFDWHNQRPVAYGYQFKSKQELRWANYLQILKTAKVITNWKYEPRTFDLKERYRKRGQYTPDFMIITDIGAEIWHEVKTSLRQKDVTRFKYFRADYPIEYIVLVLNSAPKRSVKQARLLENARKYVDEVIIAGPILRKLGL